MRQWNWERSEGGREGVKGGERGGRKGGNNTNFSPLYYIACVLSIEGFHL